MAFYNFEDDDALNFLNQETFDHTQASGHGVVAAGLAGPPSNIGGWPPLSDLEWQQQQFDMAQMMYPQPSTQASSSMGLNMSVTALYPQGNTAQGLIVPGWAQPEDRGEGSSRNPTSALDLLKESTHPHFNCDECLQEAFDQHILATQRTETIMGLMVENIGLSMTLEAERQAIRPNQRDFERHWEESAWYQAKCQALTNRAKHGQELGAQEPYHEEPTPLGSLFSEEHSPKQLAKSCPAGPVSFTPLVKDWSIGTLRLQPLQVLGTGTYGKVISALHITGLCSAPTQPDGGCVVAVKITSLGKAETFSQEVQFLEALGTDAAVPRLFATAQTNTTGLIIMEKGIATLGTLSRAVPHFSERTCKRLMRELLALIAIVHSRGYVHNDVKLDNILITSEGRMRLCDGGISRMIREMVDGTLDVDAKGCYYMAPEVRAGEILSKPTAGDVFAAGIALMHLRGLKPTEGMQARVQEAVPHHTHGLAHQFLQGLLSSPPEARLTATQALEHLWFLDCDPEPLDLNGMARMASH